MTEDQKDPTVQRNYMGSHKQGGSGNPERVEDNNDSYKEPSASEDAIESTKEIKEMEPVNHPHKQEVSLAYKDNSESGI